MKWRRIYLRGAFGGLKWLGRRSAALCRQRAAGQAQVTDADVNACRDLPEFDVLCSPLREALEEALHLSLGPPVPNTPVIYLGAREQRTPLHCAPWSQPCQCEGPAQDPTENITVVTEGSKWFRLFRPKAYHALRPLGGWPGAPRPQELCRQSQVHGFQLLAQRRGPSGGEPVQRSSFMRRLCFHVR